MEYKVLIDDSEVDFIRLEYKKAVEFVPQSFRVELANLPKNLGYMSEVKIYRNGEHVFTGYVTNIEKELGSRGYTYIISGLDNKIVLREHVLGVAEAIGTEPARLIEALVTPMARVAGKTSYYQELWNEDKTWWDKLEEGTGSRWVYENYATESSYVLSGKISERVTTKGYDGTAEWVGIYHEFSEAQDWSGYRRITFWAKPITNNTNWRLSIKDVNDIEAYKDFSIPVVGDWNLIEMAFKDFTNYEDLDWTQVKRIEIKTNSLESDEWCDTAFDWFKLLGSDWSIESNTFTTDVLNMIDGNMWSYSTADHTQTVGDYLIVNFNREVIGLCRIVIEHLAEKYPVNYALDIRKPDGTWITVKEVTGNTFRCIDHTFDPIDATAFRIRITSDDTREWAIYEIYAYAQTREKLVTLGTIEEFGFPVYGMLTNYSLAINAIKRIAEYIGWELELTPDNILNFKSQIGEDKSDTVVLEEGENVEVVQYEKDILDTFDTLVVLGAGEGASQLAVTKHWTHSDSIVWLEFEETSGDTVYDLRDEELTGTIVGDVERELTDKGRGYRFTALSDDYIHFDGQEDFNLYGKDWSICILGKFDNNNITDGGILLELTNQLRIRCNEDNTALMLDVWDGSSWETTTVEWPLSLFTSIILVYSYSDSKLAIYFNNRKIKEVSFQLKNDTVPELNIGSGFGGWIGSLQIIASAIDFDMVRRITRMHLYGRRKGMIAEKDINSLITLDKRAEVLLDYYSRPKSKLSIRAIAPLLSFDVGDSIRIKVPSFGIDEVVRIVAASWRFSVNGEELELTLGEKDTTVTTALQNIERMLNEVREFFGGLPALVQMQDADEVDSAHPIIVKLHIPYETVDIQYLYLNLWGERFRARSKATKGGGGTTVTSSSGGGTTTTSESGGYHGHEVAVGSGSGTANLRFEGGALYRVDGEPGGTFPVIWGGSHTHDVEIPSHTHTVEIPSHTHDINFGIYEGSLPETVTVYLEAPDDTEYKLGVIGEGGFYSGEIDLTPYLTYKGLQTGEWTIRIESSSNGRIRWHLYGLMYLGVRHK